MAALLTPFDHQRQLDGESLHRLVRFNIGRGILDGLVRWRFRRGSIRTRALPEEAVLRLSPKRRREKSR